MKGIQNSNKVFKSNSNYNQRVDHQKLFQKNILCNFHLSLFSAGGPFSDCCMYLIRVKDAITEIEV